MEPEAIEEKVKEVLVLLGLWDERNAYPKTLSGGMRRRVAIGRAFAYEGNCLLMDEPFKGLDYALKEQLFSDLKKLWEKYPKTIIFVTHQYEEAEALADFTYVLEGKPVRYYVKR